MILVVPGCRSWTVVTWPVGSVVTSGGPVRSSARQLRELGADIGHALCVIDRQEGGSAALAAEDIELLTRADLDR